MYRSGGRRAPGDGRQARKDGPKGPCAELRHQEIRTRCARSRKATCAKRLDRSAAARLVVPLLMGCGASAPANLTADIPTEKASRAVTQQVVEETMKMPSISTLPINHMLPATSMEPAPKALPPSMPPPADFSAFAGATAKLPREAIQALLVAIGCRKGVLLLAMSVFDDAGLDDADPGVELAAWWGALNARSRIVIESKLRGCNSGVIFAVAHACGTLTAGEPASSASSADLRESLDYVGMSEESTEAMLSGVDDAVPRVPLAPMPCKTARHGLSC